MTEYKKYELWGTIINGGAIGVAVASLIIVTNLTISVQWLYSLVCAITCFMSTFIAYRILGWDRLDKKLISSLLLIGVAELILTALYKKAVDQNSPLTIWMIRFLTLSSLGFLGSYRLILSVLFPEIMIGLETVPRNPLAEFPKSIRDIIEEGRQQVGNPAALTMLGFTMVGSIGYLLSPFIFHDAILSILFVPAMLGIFISVTLSMVLTYKWQKRARKTGIPEEELKAAAKIAGLWWPNTNRPE